MVFGSEIRKLFFCCAFLTEGLTIFTLGHFLVQQDEGQSREMEISNLSVVFDSLRPINNLSVTQGRVFLG